VAARHLSYIHNIVKTSLPNACGQVDYWTMYHHHFLYGNHPNAPFLAPSLPSRPKIAVTCTPGLLKEISLSLKPVPLVDRKHYSSVEPFLGCPLHFPWAICPFLAVVLVKTVPQYGHSDFVAVPDFSLWCRSKLLNVENCRPLHPWSQHCGFGLLPTTLTPSSTPVLLPIDGGPP
jgi:hypothetical protein